MLINKTGFEHILYGINCQDFGLDKDNKKCVVDGCSEGLHSEVGAKLFIHLFEQGMDILTIFQKLTGLFTTDEQIKNHLLFTILYIEETEDKFIVYECGDGFIIKQKHDDTVEYQKIDYSGMSPYFAYNYVNKEKLSKFKDGVTFNIYEFSKEEYKSIGVATDGLDYILRSQYVKEFEKLLVARKPAPLKRLINVNQNYQYAINTLEQKLVNQYIPVGYEPSANNFKDDITLVI